MRDRDLDIAQGLEEGADDYITKPFSHVEFLARVRAVLRRAGEKDEDGVVLQAGNLFIDLARREVRRGGEEVHLTPTEYTLLAYLVRTAGRVITYEELLDVIWGSSVRDGEMDRRVVKVPIQHARNWATPPTTPATSAPSTGWSTASSCTRRRSLPPPPEPRNFQTALRSPFFPWASVNAVLAPGRCRRQNKGAKEETVAFPSALALTVLTGALAFYLFFVLLGIRGKRPL